MRALISVSDKTGIVPFAQELVRLGYEIVSTGGTLKALADHRMPVTPIDVVTGFPEMLDGRVKTLHPTIHGGLLALRDNDAHMKTCAEHGIGLIDMVVVNLYPFEQTIGTEGVTVAEAIEQVDIGGPSMLRSASKNFQSVTVIVDPDRYASVVSELKANGGRTTLATRKALACEAFQHTARYDSVIADFFSRKVLDGQEDGFPGTVSPVLRKLSDLRYGENPHQKAAFYKMGFAPGFADFKQRHGKELSYNNIVDMEAAWQIARSFDLPGAAIIKHTNPCGAAVGASLAEAYDKAHAADPVSAFGSIVGLNRGVDVRTAEALSQTFVEAVIAPDFEPGALEILTKKPNIRLVSLDAFSSLTDAYAFRYVPGGFLMQTSDQKQVMREELTVVTEKWPSATQYDDLLFAFSLVKFVKSNAILVAADGQSIGVGAGQMSRVEAVEIALRKAGDKARGAVLASDAFFPFQDSVELAHKAGIVAIIQPGGSKRDQESIDSCNAHGLAMVFTGVRHFRH